MVPENIPMDTLSRRTLQASAMRLALWVEQSGRPIQELADQVGCHRATFHRYMAGQLMPRPGTLAKLATLTRGKVGAADLASACTDYAARSQITPAAGGQA